MLGIAVKVGQRDDFRLLGAIRQVGHDLALAVGQPVPRRLCIGTGEFEDDFSQWSWGTTMAAADDTAPLSEALAGFAERAA